MCEWCEVTGIADWQIGREGKQQVERPKKVFCCSTRHLYIYQHATDDPQSNLVSRIKFRTEVPTKIDVRQND